MLMEISEEYEVDNDSLILIPNISSIHYELINELIVEQVEDPFMSKTNYLQEYFDSVGEQMDENGENPEIAVALRNDAFDFCVEVIQLIDKKYELDIDLDSLKDLPLPKVKNIAFALYSFFIVNYEKNIKKFFVKFINKNKDILYDAVSNNKDRNDVFTNSMKNKIADEKMAIILSNLKTVINYIIDLDLDGMELISNFNPERYDIYTITEAIEDFIITESGFTNNFFYPLKEDTATNVYTRIFSAIQASLIKKYKKEW